MSQTICNLEKPIYTSILFAFIHALLQSGGCEMCG